ncbi:MAG TPA: VOC family protein [Burkholderiales bacterium]|nr:VOC family protein [Burkholderiales bacterium]
MNAADRQRPPPGELYLDHVSHFVADLDAAARVCEALGLRVTPTSVQRTPEGPVGASNRCVMLEAGYIELLSPTHHTPAATRMRALMRRYDGVHLVCYGTPDAEGEHRRLAAHGFDPQPLVALSREAAGGTARFKVVRLPPEKMPEGRIQYVEHLTPEQLWRPGDVNPLRLEEVYVVADNPVETAARWARFAGLVPRPERAGVRLESARGAILIADRAEIARLLGDAPAPPALAGYLLAGPAPRAFAQRCAAQGLPVRTTPVGLAVALPAALGAVWALRT